MQHLILGYGYCGYYLAQELLRKDQQVTAVSRHLNKDWELPGLRHQSHDLNQAFHWQEENTIIYYLIAPPAAGEQDTFLKHLLSQSTLNAKRIIYFGSSAVYGDHQGNWVTEKSQCIISNARQLRRLNAEQQWLDYASTHGMETILLRIAGIYGPNRLPIDAAKARTPLIERDKAPCTNHIYVNDLVKIAYLFSQIEISHSIFNIADGNPQPMGTLQQRVAEFLNIEPAPYESWDQAWERASLMKREFMQGSKRLNIELLQKTVQNQLYLTDFNIGIESSLLDPINLTR